MSELSTRVESTILVGDCIEKMREMPAESVDALVSDPPAGISFMSAKWDSNRGSRNAWIAWLTEVMEEAYRVMKPGAHGLVWALPRTSHWTAMALEDAGFEIRDRVTHHFGSGFPKSLDVGKQIDKLNGKHLVDLSTFGEYVKERRQAKAWSLRELDEKMGTNTAASWWEGRKSGVQLPSLQTYKRLKEVLDLDGRYDALIEWAEAEREVVGKSTNGAGNGSVVGLGSPAVLSKEFDLTTPATEEAKRWQGFGTALKPATEDWWLIRRPLSEKNVAQNVLRHSTGALNIDQCRVEGTPKPFGNGTGRHGGQFGGGGENSHERGPWSSNQGRWPPNLLLSHSPGCRPTGEIRRVKGGKAGPNSRPYGNGTIYGAADEFRPNGTEGYADPDGYEGVEEYLCVEGCPIFLMDAQAGPSKARPVKPEKLKKSGDGESKGLFGLGSKVQTGYYDESAQVSRFFPRFPLEPSEAPFKYQSKASKKDRTANGTVSNGHPTCKPTPLLRWLIRLVTPPGGLLLDCFAGSGSTGVAAILEGFDSVLIEQDEEYAATARARCEWAKEQVGESSPRREKPAALSQTPKPLETLF